MILADGVVNFFRVTIDRGHLRVISMIRFFFLNNRMETTCKLSLKVDWAGIEDKADNLFLLEHQF